LEVPQLFLDFERGLRHRGQQGSPDKVIVAYGYEDSTDASVLRASRCSGAKERSSGLREMFGEHKEQQATLDNGLPTPFVPTAPSLRSAG
jgi:hypothetical protein